MAIANVHNNHPKMTISLKPLKEIVLAVLSGEKRTCESLSVSLTDNDSVKKLNKRWRGKNVPTDVLSFNFNEEGFLGEIIISLDKAKSQASEFGVSLLTETKRLVVHGLLHLLGYRHHKRTDRLIMECTEERYLCVSHKQSTRTQKCSG